MATYLVKRIFLILPTFLGITFVVFLLTRFIPGGPLERYLQESLRSDRGEGRSASSSSSSQFLGHSFSASANGMNPEQLQQLKKFYGLDQPFFISYLIWLKKIFSGDLGDSVRYQEPVSFIISDRIKVSLIYGSIYLLITTIFSIALGLLKAFYHKSYFDYASSLLIFFFYAIPSYLLGLIFFFLFSCWLDWFPLGGLVSDDYSSLSFFEKMKDLIWHATLPLLAYIIQGFAFMTLLVKNSVREEMSKEYVVLALVKGVSRQDIFLKHILKNSLIPIMTHLGQNLTILVSGSFLIELIFNIDGMGLLAYDSLMNRDYPIVMGILVITSMISLLGHLIADIMIASLDPRVRIGEKIKCGR